MKCRKCGNDIDNKVVYCPSCGNKIRKNNKIIYLAIIMLLALLIIGIIMYNNSSNISWNKTYSDYKLKYITDTNVKLGINLKNENAIKDIKYNVSCGEITTNNLEINWDLTNSLGKCVITVSYKSQKITKEYTIIKEDISEKELALDYEIDYDSTEDLDFDGLTNKEEKEYGTNPVLYDSDFDGLSDYEEIFTYKTNPINKDTDNDGLNDYDEIILGLDPLKEDTLNDGIKDGNRELTYDYEIDNIKLSIFGSGNIASTSINVSENTILSNKKGLIDKLYTLYTSGNMSTANISIAYTDDELTKYNLEEDSLSIYYYNELENAYEKVNTIIDKENNILSATLNHFSNYVIGDSNILKEKENTQVLFILDNSWSMYSPEQYKELTNEDIGEDSIFMGSDKDGIRFSLTSDLITRLINKNYQIGLSEFRNDYKNVLKIGSDEESLKTKLNSMNGNFVTSYAGTNISNALIKGMNEFTNDVDNKYIVILTDGEDNSLKNRVNKIINTATSNDIKICSIGFGSGSYNNELSDISSSTGCKLYSSSDVSGLKELFDNIGTILDNGLVDIDNDNNPDGILLADSGFIVNRDGFSFGNYGTNYSPSGHCFGMATFAELYYKKVLPLSFGSKINGDLKSNAYDLTNTYFKNYDNLYDYTLKSNALKYVFGFELFGEEYPTDIRTLEGKKIVFNDKYEKEILSYGFYELKEEKSNLSKEQQIERFGYNYDTAVNISLNEDKMQTSDNIDNDDLQLFNAIWAGFIRQNNISFYSSGSNFTLWLRDLLGRESIEYKGEDGFINILKSRLNNQDAPVIVSSFSSGLHAVNAISLVQDIDNPNHYFIGVYDNNYPNEKRYVEIECKKDMCMTIENDYYTRSSQPIRITASLEYDLSFYK